jgi:hypothetical protein
MCLAGNLRSRKKSILSSEFIEESKYHPSQPCHPCAIVFHPLSAQQKKIRIHPFIPCHPCAILFFNTEQQRYRATQRPLPTHD